MDENRNIDKKHRSPLDVIDLLDRGNLLKDPFLISKVDKALRGDTTGLEKFLERHPDIIEKAKTNIFINCKLTEANPFWPPPYKTDEVTVLTGPLQFGSYNPFKDICFLVKYSSFRGF